MPLRPGRCYRRLKRPYTRTEYIAGAPYVQIPRFELGNTKPRERARFDYVAELVAEETGQIRANALEAARQMAYKYLSKYVGDPNFYLKINVYPFHVIRENKMLAMAGADRLQQGMRLAFGVPSGRAARILRPGTIIMHLEIEGKNLAHAKEALKRAASKLPLPMRIVIYPKQAQAKVVAQS
ncbi:50S ribosomal protein L16 [Vulcanisaeta distributa]|uniref:Large ribosomal subunit protein uL16 n=1 Tax=Vulcanisaeta distributa (strain DSM 14429 / JCM 11212 / NBRC 100878 / IC-017) TaxID=572478 RepID=E1QRP9_VULDI|nr:50S ribosomal protein L16 [Vulcanisaeta distributa]ADN49424.1 Ribosomal protein L10e/L16 [Vulcanisaeta distributa DSM 14429]